MIFNLSKLEKLKYHYSNVATANTVVTQGEKNMEDNSEMKDVTKMYNCKIDMKFDPSI